MTHPIKFKKEDLKRLWSPKNDSSGEDNGQVTIIGGSELFSGAPLLSLVAVSRLVDMVFLATPEQDKGIADNVTLFSKLKSVIWVPREDLDKYVEKTDAILIGPGLMRYHTTIADDSGLDAAGTETKMLSKYLLQKYPHKKWVIDGGSLQTMEASWIPKNAILTPNSHEFRTLASTSPLPFPSPNLGEGLEVRYLEDFAAHYGCVVVSKGPTSYVTDGNTTYEVDGGNAGLTKGGTGDTLAGLITGLFAKNDGLLSAAAGSFVIKKTAEYLYKKVGYNFSADDVAENVFQVFKSLA